MEEAGELAGLPPMKPQLQPSPGVGERKAVGRRRERVVQMLHTLPAAAQHAIRESYASDPLPAPRPADPPARPASSWRMGRRSAPRTDDSVPGYPPRVPGYGPESDSFDTFDQGYGGDPEGGPPSRPDSPPPPSGPGRHRT
jgi:phospholipid/cholesterol/gamma-HCH transport system ATP-binding protein